MEIRFKAWIGWAITGLGAVNLALQVWLYTLSGEFGVAVLTGLICVAIGPLMLTRPLYTVERGRLQVLNLIGFQMAEHPLADLDVETDDRGRQRIVLPRPGRRPKTLLSAPSALYDADALAAVVAKIEGTPR